MSLAYPGRYRRRSPDRADSRNSLTTKSKATTRLQVVRLTFLLYALLLAEGALRKWALPQLDQALYFVRDPLVVVIYALAFSGGWLVERTWLKAWLAVGACAGALSLAVHFASGIHLAVWVLGIRAYFLYIPLTFIVAATWRRDDFERFLRFNLYILPLLALLALAQMNAPTTALINRGAGDADAVSLALELPRTNNVFAHGSQFAAYIPGAAALVLAAMVLPRVSGAWWRLLLAAALVAVLVMLIASGSRGAWMRAGAVGGTAIVIGVFVKGGGAGRLKALQVPILAALAVAVLFGSVFEASYEAYQIRNEHAGTFTHQTTDRIAGMFLPNSMFTVSIAGEGIGLGLTGAAAFLGGERGFLLGETDWDRNFAELGLVVGGAFVLLRICFALWLCRLAWWSLRRDGNPVPMALCAYAAPMVLINQITIHTIFGHLAWFFSGLVIAAAYSGRELSLAHAKGPNAPYRYARGGVRYLRLALPRPSRTK